MTTTSKNPIKKPLDQVIGFVMAAVSHWRKENTEEAIHKKVIDLLDKRSEEMVVKLLGFDLSWGEWALDHCNGRSGNSAIGDYLRNTQAVAVKEFFDSLDLKQIVTPAMKNRLIKAIQKDFEYKLECAVRSALEAHTKQYVEKVIQDITTSDDLDGVIKTIKLLETN